MRKDSVRLTANIYKHSYVRSMIMAFILQLILSQAVKFFP